MQVDGLFIEDEWKEPLDEAGLGTLEALLAFDCGKCLSRHKRAQTFRHQLPNGQVVFIKQDLRTKPQIILRALGKFHRPLPNTVKERLILEMLAQHGFLTPKIIAWGEKKGLFGLPDKAVMVQLAQPGVPLDEYVVQGHTREEKEQAVAKSEAVLKDLQDAGFDWYIDCKPEHFFVLDNGKIGLIDLERLKVNPKGLTEEYRKMQFNRFHSLLPKF